MANRSEGEIAFGMPVALAPDGASGDPVNAGEFKITCLAHDCGAFPGGVVFDQGTGPKYVQAHKTDCPLWRNGLVNILVT